jgi:hypothetical protein
MLGVPWVCAVGREEASVAVANAEGSLQNAFRTVSDAEGAGANVSALMKRLNQADDALTGAEVALAAGNYSDATNKAEMCQGLAHGVSGDAVVLKTGAVAAFGYWWVTVLVSVVCSVVFVGAVFFVWRWFKRGYVKKMLGSRPGVMG